MGSWNSTCAVSNLHILEGSEVVTFLLVENFKEKEFYYNSALYQFCPIPIYGNNDSYGGVEDCHSAGQELLVSTLRDSLYEREVGDNKFHDIAVKKEGFNIYKLFEADHENRLAIMTNTNHFNYHHEVLEVYESREKTQGLTGHEVKHKKQLQEELEKGIPPFQQVKHIQIHAQIFKDIIENFKLETYINNKSKKVTFADIEKDIPQYIMNIKERAKSATFLKYLSFYKDDNNLAASFIQRGRSHEGLEEILVTPTILVKHGIDNLNDKDFAALLTDYLKGIWIDIFMQHTRKVWTPQCGVGSQSEEAAPYELLMKSMKNVLKAQKNS